jgi:hypothetical protein
MTASGDAGARTYVRTRVRGVKSLMYSKGVRCPVCDAHLDLGATVRLRGKKGDPALTGVSAPPVSPPLDDFEQEPPATAEGDSDG